MSYRLTILFVVATGVLFFLFVIIQKYSIKKALYYTLSILGMIMILMFLSNIYDFIFKNLFSILLLMIPFALIITYCEKFFIQEEKADAVHQPRVTPRPEPITQNKPDYKKEFEERQQRIELYKSVPLEDIEKVINELTRMTTRQVIRIETEDADNLPITASKYGGMPYIPSDGMPPSDKDGRQLRLLAQLNMAELPGNDFMPKEGILQFWALNNNMYGLEEYHLTTKNTSRVVYHKKIDIFVIAEDVVQKYQPWREEDHEDHFPILHEFALKFTLSEEGMGSEDSRWDKIFAELWNEKHPNMEVYYMEELPNALDYSEYEADFNDKIGGYPNFVQRNRHGEGDVLLLQITSSYRRERRIQWGDSGVSNFFIKPEDLAKHDFSNVLYHWDCH